MGILSEIHPTDGKVTIGPVRAEKSAELRDFARKAAGKPPKDVTVDYAISSDELTVVFDLDWTDGNEAAILGATEWSAKVQVKAAKEFEWGGSS